MSSRLHLTGNLSDLSDRDIADLNQIFYTSVLYRDNHVDRARKLSFMIVTFLCFICNLGIITRLIVQQYIRRYLAFTIWLGVVNTLLIATYISFIVPTYSNVYYTPQFVGSSGCPSFYQTKFEVVRAVIIHAMEISGRWFVLILAVVHYQVNMYQSWFQFRCQCETFEPLVILILMVLSFCEQIHNYFPEITTYTRNDICYEWHPGQTVYPLEFMIKDVLPLSFLFVLAVTNLILKREIKKKGKSFKAIGILESFTPKMLVEVNNMTQVNLVVLISEVALLPTIIRRFLILTGRYHLLAQDYIADELFCDICDALNFISSTIAFFLFHNLTKKKTMFTYFDLADLNPRLQKQKRYTIKDLINIQTLQTERVASMHLEKIMELQGKQTAMSTEHDDRVPIYDAADARSSSFTTTGWFGISVPEKNSCKEEDEDDDFNLGESALDVDDDVAFSISNMTESVIGFFKRRSSSIASTREAPTTQGASFSQASNTKRASFTQASNTQEESFSQASNNTRSSASSSRKGSEADSNDTLFLP